MSLMSKDARNVIDRFKGTSEADIIRDLDNNGVELEVAIENLERDFNMGTIVRSANAFGIRVVHIIGRKQWNKRGAMATDKYLHIKYYQDIESFASAMSKDKKQIIAIDNVDGSINLTEVKGIPARSVLVFGSEASGISDQLLAICDQTIAIEQKGSTRSLNVGVAAGIAMYTLIHKSE